MNIRAIYSNRVSIIISYIKIGPIDWGLLTGFLLSYKKEQSTYITE